MIRIIKHLRTAAVCALAGALLSACALNGAASLPSTTQANLSTNALQFAVGTANINGSRGLNVVATLRQPSGKTGVLADLPTLTGPAGFAAGSDGAYSSATYGPNIDAGTAHISGSPQVALNNAGLKNTTFGTFTGVFSYGFGPYNCDQNCTSLNGYWPGNPNNAGGNGFFSSNYACFSAICQAAAGINPAATDVGLVQPFYAGAGNGFDFIVGPPAVPFFNDGTYPSGFAGYSAGFTTFAVTPVAGQYALNVNVPASNANPTNYSANANLNSTTALGNITVAATGETTGGLTGTVTIPTGVTETEVFIVDVSGASGSQTFYTVGPISGTGTQNWTLPGNLGPCHGSNCENGANATPSLSHGDPANSVPPDTYFVVAVGYDYPAFEAGPPGNTQQKPTITGANGQADLTMSDPTFHATY